MLLSSMMNGIKRGALIVIEGVDRSGKSTQCRKLVESLGKKNIKSELMSFPDRTTHTGELISKYLSTTDSILNDKTIHLLFSANRWENVEKMKKLIKSGVTLIVDRYSYSGIAFSSVKGVDPDWCKNPEMGLPKPDVVFLLNVSTEALTKRPGYGKERYENPEMQREVSNIFHHFAETENHWEVIDASGSLEEVHNRLLNSILLKLEYMTKKPLEILGEAEKDKENFEDNYQKKRVRLQ